MESQNNFQPNLNQPNVPPQIPQDMPPLAPQPAAKRVWSKLALLVVGLLIIAGGAYAFLTYNQEAILQETPQLPIGQVIDNQNPTATSNVPADWKTYRNEEYGFELKYPPYAIKTDNTYGKVTDVLIELIQDKVRFDVTITSDLSLCTGPYQSLFGTITENKLIKDGNEWRYINQTDKNGFFEDRYYYARNSFCFQVLKTVLDINSIKSEIKTDLDDMFSTFKFTK